MSDLINRQDAIDTVIKRDANCGIDSAEVLKKLPPAQPYTDEEIQAMQDLEQAQLEKAYETGLREGRKKGEWVKEYWNGEHTRKCSACNITQTVTTYRGKVNFNYCPYCGADMRGEEDDKSNL